MRDQTARAEYYRSKAEEVRIIAESMKSADAKEFLMNVSFDYTMLANLVDHMVDPIPASE